MAPGQKFVQDTDMPTFYDCQRCTACCRWPGQVRLSDAEISRLAAFKKISESEFIQQFTRLRSDRRGLVLQDKPNGECIFLDGNDCSVQPVKPQQCRDFPNRWNFPGFEKICHAIPREGAVHSARGGRAPLFLGCMLAFFKKPIHGKNSPANLR